MHRNTTSTEAPSPARLKSTRTQVHPFCFVCSKSNPLGLGLEFSVNDDGSVSASFLGHSALEGYQGCMHGGVIAALLDGAMTDCLFAHGHVAMTGELKVRYREPVIIGEKALLRAWITQSLSPLHLLKAELQQQGCVKATASAKFVERNGTDNNGHHTGRE